MFTEKARKVWQKKMQERTERAQVDQVKIFINNRGNTRLLS